MSPPASDAGASGPGDHSAEAGDAGLWAALRSPKSEESFQQAWLALQCRLIPDVRAGLLLLGPADRGPFKPAAVWPRDPGDLSPLAAAAERALAERAGVVLERSEGSASHAVAQPIQLQDTLLGVVALAASPRPDKELARVLAQLRWGAAWFATRSGSRDEALAARAERMRAVLELAASIPDGGRFREAATALATEIATRLDCERVSLGWIARGRARLVAMSHSAQFGSKANLTRAIEAAMDEMADQRTPVVVPDPAGAESPLVTRAHEQLVQQLAGGAALSVPLVRAGEVRGALTLERARPFAGDEQAVCEAVAALVGPMLDAQQRDERWIGSKVAHAAGHALGALVGPGAMAAKLSCMAALGLVLLGTFAEGDFRVTAKSRIEAEEQRAAVAPFDGFLAAAPVRAGDLVSAGDLLARLDDRDLALERARLSSQVAQLDKRRRQASAEREAAEVRILGAQLDQAAAQLELAEDRLRRIEIRAPFDGIVTRGDQSQSLGAPVARGDTLFEVAPLEAFRVVLEVDEADVREVRVGQSGSLVLASAPREPLSFEVAKITPISISAEGRNFFRVEGRLAGKGDRLRPGMEGVGKISVGERRLAWIWTRGLVSRLRLFAWSWLP